MSDTVLLLHSYKIVVEAFRALERELSNYTTVKSIQLSRLSRNIDLINYRDMSKILDSYRPFNAVVTGDVFWPTGQNVCSYCSTHRIPIYFLQHGQWIYIKNKTNPSWQPSHALFFGSDTAARCDSWPRWSNCQKHVVGSPRYDECSLDLMGDYVYFSPPVIREEKPRMRDDQNVIDNLRAIGDFGIEHRVVLQPHYRERQIGLLKEMFPSCEFLDPLIPSLPTVQKSHTVVCCRNSTVVLDALACGKRVVLTDLSKYNKSFFEMGYFDDFACESLDVSFFCANLNQRKRECFPVDYLERVRRFIALGNASRRIAKIVLKDEL